MSLLEALSNASDDDRLELAVAVAVYTLMPAGSRAAKRGLTEKQIAKLAARVDKALVEICVRRAFNSLVERGKIGPVAGKPGYFQVIPASEFVA